MVDKRDARIEQLEVQLSGVEGLLNEIINLINLFMPILRAMPQTDKKMLGELEKRLQISQMMLSMKKQSPPTIVDSMGLQNINYDI